MLLSSLLRRHQALRRLRLVAYLLPIPQLRYEFHIGPKLGLVGVVRASRVARGPQRRDPARAGPVGGIEDIAVDRKTRNCEVVEGVAAG